MAAISDVEVPVLPLSRLQPVMGEQRHARLEAAAARTRRALHGATVWNVSSTASGGGVAEMLQVLVGYVLGAEIDTRWLVVHGDAAFFSITKRIHNRLHGAEGSPGELGERDVAHYHQVLARAATEMRPRVHAGDVVLLHDPQTAGLAAPLAAAGAVVMWRCHIGSDITNRWTDEAWQFLRPHLAACQAFVFSRRAYVPAWLPDERVAIITPSIDPFSPKNQDLSGTEVSRILASIGVLTGGRDNVLGSFTRRDGTAGQVVRRAEVVADRGPLDPAAPLVVQVSRWDRLKDMGGVMEGFASRVTSSVDAHLALVGPSVEGVDDDPEGAEVLAECVAAWEALPTQARRRIRLVSLPMADVDENAAMVNAVQRHATVIVQKSLVEGFGLTVAEAMWKAKPIVASAVGGIVDQLTPRSGVLLADPADLDAFGDALARLLRRPAELATLGRRARLRVLRGFVGDLHLAHYARLIQRVVSA